MDNHAFHVIHQDTSKITSSSDPSDFLHVPSEGNLFKTHCHYACGTTDDEHRTTHTSTVSQQLPEDAV